MKKLFAIIYNYFWRKSVERNGVKIIQGITKLF